MPPNLTKLDQVRLWISLIFYGISLTLPGLHLVDGKIVEGWRLLLTAWYGFLILEIPWLANPLFLLAVIFASRGSTWFAGIFASLAFFVGLLSLRSTMWLMNYTHIDSLGAGFYLWMAAFVLLATTLLPLNAGYSADRTGGR